MMMRTIELEHSLKIICKKIIALDTKIRFVGIINERSRLVTGVAKNKVKFLVDKKDREILFMEIALRTRMRQEFDHCLGSVNFSITYRENIVTMRFPIEMEILYVSAEKCIKLDEIPFKIFKILKNSD